MARSPFPHQALEPGSRFEGPSFVLTADHVRLLRRAYVSWHWPVPGGPGVAGSRPFGNGDVADDIARILEWPAECWDEELCLLTKHRRRAEALHEELLGALTVVLGAGSFEPGTYVRESRTQGPAAWRRVPEGEPPSFS